MRLSPYYLSQVEHRDSLYRCCDTKILCESAGGWAGMLKHEEILWSRGKRGG